MSKGKGSETDSDRVKYVRYLARCAFAERKNGGKEVNDLMEFVPYWDLIVFQVKQLNWTSMADRNGEQMSQSTIPADVVDRHSHMFQCQSCCSARALIRVHLTNLSMVVDLCSHHYVAKVENSAHKYTVLIDRRASVLGAVKGRDQHWQKASS